MSDILREVVDQYSFHKNQSDTKLFKAVIDIACMWSDKSDSEISDLLDRKKELKSNREKLFTEGLNEFN